MTFFQSFHLLPTKRHELRLPPASVLALAHLVVDRKVKVTFGANLTILTHSVLPLPFFDARVGFFYPERLTHPTVRCYRRLSSEHLLGSKYISRSIPRPNFHRNDSSSDKLKLPHTSFQSPKIDTKPKKTPLFSSYSVAYHVPAPVGLKNLHITIGSATIDWSQIFW